MTKKNKIPLFYWSEKKFIFREKENYGDLLSKYLVEKISGEEVKWVHPKKQRWYKLNKTNFLAIGSIIHHASKDSVVWGSGIIDAKQPLGRAEFRAVRGPQTRQLLLETGYSCPEVYGDPALLLPKYYNPEVQKKFRIGIIPHYHDFEFVFNQYKFNDDIQVIDLMTENIEEVTQKILQCEKTISSSLHGLIVSHAYAIPSVWVKFSDKIFGDGIKYRDYLESVGITFYDAVPMKEKFSLSQIESLYEEFPALIKKEILETMQKELLEACPFRKL